MCRSGNQSRMMCDFLHAKGYTSTESHLIVRTS